jgi:hypothetical protein
MNHYKYTIKDTQHRNTLPRGKRLLKTRRLALIISGLEEDYKTKKTYCALQFGRPPHQGRSSGSTVHISGIDVEVRADRHSSESL